MMRKRLNHTSPWRMRLQKLRRMQLAGRRLLSWAVSDQFAAPRYASSAPATMLGQVRVALVRGGAHPILERGKRHNVMLAATALDYLQVGPEQPLSFWRAVGPLTAARGYEAGMELQGGCAVPAIGGGVCALSNALYQLAAELGWRIIERHAHTAAVGSVTQLDATVAFPHVDLRVQPDRDVVLRLEVRGDVLIVAAWASQTSTQTVHIRQRTSAVADQPDTFRVITERVIHFGAVRYTETLSNETRTQLPAQQVTCVTCDELDCDAGNQRLQAAGLTRGQS
jgi:vancomycin resistance protein VanW